MIKKMLYLIRFLRQKKNKAAQGLDFQSAAIWQNEMKEAWL
ncbi:UvrB/UvrC motif-containing protein [Sinobaca sp. H24]